MKRGMLAAWCLPSLGPPTETRCWMTNPYETVQELLKEAEPEAFNWDEHLSRLANADQEDRARRREEEASVLGEWEPTTQEDLELMASVGGEEAFALESEPPSFHQRWDDVDPEEHNYRNVPNGAGYSWSRIRLRSDWWQFDENLKLKDGHARFDVRSFEVPDAAFEGRPDPEFGHIDPIIAAKLLPTLTVLDATSLLLEANATHATIQYRSLAKHRHGIEAYARGLAEKTAPDVHLTFTAFQVVDAWDGAALFSRADLGTPTDLC